MSFIPPYIEKDINRLAPDCDADLVYAWMLLEDFRFGNASKAKMTREIKAAANMVRHDMDMSIRVARTYGLRPAA